MQFQVSAHQYHKINFNIERQIIKGCICFTKECSAIGRQNFGYLPNQSNAKEKQSHFLICTQALIIGAPGRSFLCVREDLRRVEQRFAGGLALTQLQCQTPCRPRYSSRYSSSHTFLRAKKLSSLSEALNHNLFYETNHDVYAKFSLAPCYIFFSYEWFF